jgi:hypothetical protein
VVDAKTIIQLDINHCEDSMRAASQWRRASRSPRFAQAMSASGA